MTGETATVPPAGGRRRWLKVALVVSLVLNVCFVAGPFLWHAFAPTPAQRFHQRVIHRLDLSLEQRRAFDDFTRTMRQARRLLHDSNEPLTEGVWNEEAKATPDQASVAQLLAQADDNRRHFAQTATTALATFMAALTPQQRAAFVDLIKNNQNRAVEHMQHSFGP